jgi:predicted ABC-type ATPase
MVQVKQLQHLAVKRVIKRVEQGGHYIPEDTVRRRYYAGIKNLITHYLPLAERALILDNSLTLRKAPIKIGLESRMKEPHVKG